MAQQNDLISEAAAALRGVIAVTIGNREAARHFNLTTRGLAGSFIALLLVAGIGAGLPLLYGVQGRVLLSVVGFTVSFALQVSFAAIALNQARRLDGFVPYMVVDNWASAYVTASALVLNLMGVSDDLIGFPIGVLVVIVAVNIGRVILRLEPLQIAMFVIAQVVGYLVAGMVLSLFMPMPGINS